MSPGTVGYRLRAKRAGCVENDFLARLVDLAKTPHGSQQRDMPASPKSGTAPYAFLSATCRCRHGYLSASETPTNMCRALQHFIALFV